MSKKIMVLGATGQIGSELILELRKRFGGKNVIGVGHSRTPSKEILESGSYETGNVLDTEQIDALCVKHDVGTIYHLAAVLSGVGEKDPQVRLGPQHERPDQRPGDRQETPDQGVLALLDSCFR
ncbi:MAG: NAD-dependent epimerase/dehydratase family protein [Methanomassiliicoccales archaeon]